MIFNANSGRLLAAGGGVSPDLRDFLASELGKKASLVVDNPPYCTYRCQLEVGAGDGPNVLGGLLMYEDGMLSRALLTLSGAQTWAEWSWQSALKDGQRLRHLVEQELGPLPRTFDWGIVTYEEDAARQSCGVVVEYRV